VAAAKARPIRLEEVRVNARIADSVHVGNSSGSRMDVDYSCLCNLLERKDALMKYQCGAYNFGNSTDVRLDVRTGNTPNPGVFNLAQLRKNVLIFTTKSSKSGLFLYTL
jgi:hypothetical protein